MSDEERLAWALIEAEQIDPDAFGPDYTPERLARAILAALAREGYRIVSI